MRPWVLVLAYATAFGVAAWGAWTWRRYRLQVVHLLRAILDALQTKARREDPDVRDDDQE